MDKNKFYTQRPLNTLMKMLKLGSECKNQDSTKDPL